MVEIVNPFDDGRTEPGTPVCFLCHRKILQRHQRRGFSVDWGYELDFHVGCGQPLTMEALLAAYLDEIKDIALGRHRREHGH